MHFNPLANAVNPADRLLQAVGIQGQIEQYQMPCHLKIAPLGANSRTNHDLRAVFFQKPRRLTIPLDGPHRLVKTRDLALGRDQRLVKGLDLGAVGAQHQHFLPRMLRHKIS